MWINKLVHEHLLFAVFMVIRFLAGLQLFYLNKKGQISEFFRG